MSKDKIHGYIWRLAGYICNANEFLQLTGKKERAKVQVQYVTLPIGEFHDYLLPFVKEVLFPDHGENQRLMVEEVEKLLKSRGSSSQVVFAVFKTSHDHQAFTQASGKIIHEDLSDNGRRAVLAYYCPFAFNWFMNEFRPEKRHYN